MPDELVLPTRVDDVDLQAVRLLNERARINALEEERYELALARVREKLGLPPGTDLSPDVEHEYQLDLEQERLADEQASQAADAVAFTTALKTKYSLDEDDTYDPKTGVITRNS